MSRVEYHAGFFDGEGSIGIYRNGQGTWYLRTQLTQNKTTATTELLSEMVSKYGGNLAIMRSDIYQGGRAFNWQLNSAVATLFLKKVYPYLRLKKEQAFFAIAWEAISQKAKRAPNGRMMPHDKERVIDDGAAKLLKALKRNDIDAVMSAQSDLVDIVYTLKQIVCVKG